MTIPPSSRDGLRATAIELKRALQFTGSLIGLSAASFASGAIQDANAGSAQARSQVETQDTLFGYSLCALGDLDGDGVDEFAVSAPAARAGKYGCGSVLVFSGLTLKVIRRFDGRSLRASLGSFVMRARDLDGDGQADLAIESMFSGLGLMERPIFLSPAKDGVIPQSVACARLSIHGAPCTLRSRDDSYSQWTDRGESHSIDWDRDGWLDRIVARSASVADVLSGRDGTALAALAQIDDHSGIGAPDCDWLALDSNGDGTPDVVLNSAGKTWVRPGAVSGAEEATPLGAPLELVDSTSWAPTEAGFRLFRAGDLDCDGIDDFLLDKEDEPFNVYHHLFAYSGRSRSLLWSHGHGYAQNSSCIIDRLSDRNGDAAPDVLCSNLYCSDDFDADGNGTLFILSGRDGSELALLNERDVYTAPETARADTGRYASFEDPLQDVDPARDQSAECGRAFGFAVCALGDLDGRSAPDFAVSAPAWNEPYGDGGRVVLISGEQMRVLGRIGGAQDDWFDARLIRVDDIDGDGLADLAVDHEGADASPRFYSSANGSEIPAQMAADVLSLGDGACSSPSKSPLESLARPSIDWNHDGCPDEIRYVSSPPSRVDVSSGVDGALLAQFHLPIDGLGPAYSRYAWLASDVDGDGTADLVLNASLPASARVMAVSCSTGIRLFDVTLSVDAAFSSSDSIDLDFVAAGDLDADGAKDFLVIVPGLPRSTLIACNGRTGRPLWSKLCDFGGRRVGAVDVLGDWNGDRAPEILCSGLYCAPNDAAWALDGGVKVLSGRNGNTLMQISERDVFDAFSERPIAPRIRW